ncbi:hypothetical protein K435DRAFT_961594 [Dendrothele bispora CBS 962.96]|uniref:Phosphatidylglycerol/phosphatidylinositol transfer protein n=1 Tax=Dendrothele bispora (strain CBS 962.96) TaxID=1314807 RepID=A0A4S8MPM0_DENBC|nr:hypothetical protein K435DRAFT_961594 [Dendrothele bispora CBS 962.96]
MLRLYLLAAFCFFGVVSANAAEQIAMQSEAPVHAAAGWEWDDCGEPTDAIQVKSIKVSPDPPRPGEDMTVTVEGTALETIEAGASADVTVKLGLIKILSKTFDVCEEASKANASIQCPVEQGDHKVIQTVALPKEIPPAKFKVHVDGYTHKDDPMLCLDLTIDFMKHLW